MSIISKIYIQQILGHVIYSIVVLDVLFSCFYSWPVVSSCSDNTDASEEVKLHFTDELFRIESCEGVGSDVGEGESRTNKPACDVCKDNPRRKCKSCACSVCGGKEEPDKQLLCDECDQAYHLWCLSTPLESVPEEDEW